ncbi:hypothetical protein NBCG_01809 [Nocardioidaceae bacterium Broad-1]|uniref:Uncharacterized protein n=1 Tax=Nocardioides panzhihuensis TaxID=860243 RepID=A0A7Z0DMZ2_9ACTN|nr:hypothetical protein [Nocardioides panzhihuensis]EGD43941.1 hypothetical protein NBCG_01809 [Nocardioidaceae bacterium Broad-1]NYI78211.1 hypothetical protein [Nocardioides panzhihuensis]
MSTATVITTAAFSHPGYVGGRATDVPISEVHAKKTGTITTLCGQSALTWFKFWEVPFATVLGNRCPRCVAAFDELLQAEADRRRRSFHPARKGRPAGGSSRAPGRPTTLS